METYSPSTFRSFIENCELQSNNPPGMIKMVQMNGVPYKSRRDVLMVVVVKRENQKRNPVGMTLFI